MRQLIVAPMVGRQELERRSLYYLDLHTSPKGTVRPIFDELGEGVAALLNRTLRGEWEPSDDFVRVDTDTMIQTPRWNEIMSEIMWERDLAMASPVWPTGMPANGVLCSGVLAVRADWVERLGGWHSYGPYGYEDLDYQYRCRALGGKLEYVPEVVVENLGQERDRDWKLKQRALNERRKEYRMQCRRYDEGFDLWQPFD